MTPSWSSFIRMESPDPHHSALRVLHYVFPAILLAYYVIAEIISICTLQNLRSRGHKINRKLIVLLQCAVLTLYAIEAVLLVLNSSLSLVGKSSTDDNVSPLPNNSLYVRTFTRLTTLAAGRSMCFLKCSYGLSSVQLSSSQGMTLCGIHCTDHGPFPL